MRAVTFGELIDDTMTRLGFAGETGSLRDVAESVIRAAHEERCVARDYSFMRMPAPSTFTTVAGQRTYSLSPYFRAPIWFRDRTTGAMLVEAHSAMQADNGRPTAVSTSASPGRFELRGHSNVWAQPTTPGVVTSSASADDVGKSLMIEGLDATGSFVTGTVTVAGIPASTDVTFSVVTNIRKNGTGWLNDISVTSGSVTLATFTAANYGTYLRQFYFLDSPEEGRVVEYDFWRLPAPLDEDNDIPSIPSPYSRVLVYDALLSMVGYSRATQAEMKRWEEKQQELQHAMDAAYDEAQSNGADVNYVHVIER